MSGSIRAITGLDDDRRAAGRLRPGAPAGHGITLGRVEGIRARRQPRAAARAARRLRADGLRRPAVQHRPGADAPHARHASRPRPATGPASAGAATPPSCSRPPPTATRSTTTSASSSRACASCAACCTPRGTLYLHLDYREAHARQAAARRAVRPRVLPQRADLGLRLRRQAEAPLAAEARHDPRLRQGPGRLLLRRRGGRARAVHGARPRHAREGRAREDAGQRHLAHDRLPHRPREDRLPDAEARGPRAPLRARLLAPRRPRARTRSPARARSARSRPRPAAATC